MYLLNHVLQMPVMKETNAAHSACTAQLDFDSTVTIKS